MRGAPLYPRHADTGQDILDMLAAGTSEKEILSDYPYLELDDIRAAMAYAAAYLNHRIVPAPST